MWRARTTLISMWRRAAILGLLWVGLSGLLPAAFACAMDVPETRDCCPPGQSLPCSSDRNPYTRDGAACCVVQAAPVAAATGTFEKSKRIPADDLSPDPAMVPGAGASNPWSGSSPPDIPIRLFARSDGSQIYLQTGRLRL